MKRVRWLVAAGVLSALATPALQAQDEPAAGSEAPLTLAHRYKNGQIQRFRGSTSGAMTLTIDAGAGSSFGPVPLGLNQTFAFSEKVTGTRQGAGTLIVALESLTLTSDVMGQKAVIKLQNGKVTSSLTGQNVGGAIPGANAKMLEEMIQTKPTTIRRGPTGSTISGEAPVPGMGSMLGGNSIASLIQLPESPVKIGDSWETKQLIVPQVSGPLAAAGGIPAVEMKLTHTLRDVVSKGGKRLAIIDTSGVGTPQTAGGGGPAPVLNQSFVGNTRFDVGRGAITSGQYTVEMDLKMPLPQLARPGAAPGGQGAAPTPGGLQIQGAYTIKLAEGAATPAKKTPAKARRKK